MLAAGENMNATNESSRLALPCKSRKRSLLPAIIACVCLLPAIVVIAGIGGCVALQTYYINKGSLLSTANELQPLMPYSAVLALLPTNRLDTVRTQKADSPGWSGVVVVDTNITVTTELRCCAKADGGFFSTAYPDQLYLYFNKEDELVAVYFRPYYHTWKPTWGVQVDIKCDGGRLVPSEEK